MMRIGELATRVGVNPKTIRFYEEKGLLSDPVRLASGYRDCGSEDEARLQFIRTAQRLRLLEPAMKTELPLPLSSTETGDLGPDLRLRGMAHRRRRPAHHLALPAHLEERPRDPWGGPGPPNRRLCADETQGEPSSMAGTPPGVG